MSSVDTADTAEGTEELSMADVVTRLMVYLELYKQRGQGLVEYALIMVLISIVAIVIMTALGGNINTIFQRASNALVNP